MKKLILASQSPRRRELLEKCGIPFTVEAAGITETIDHSAEITSEIKRLAEAKASAVFALHPDSIVIGSDTVVVINGKVMGKPKDRHEAAAMLHDLSDNVHQVITGLCIISADRKYTDVTVSDVYFEKISDEEIDAYTATAEPYDKAGAYAIQGWAGKYIKRIDGDYYSIVGFPLSIVYKELKNISLY